MNQVELREFLRGYTQQCDRHEDWLVLIRFGMGSLLQHPAVLVDVLFAEAMRESKRSGNTTGGLSELKRILGELNLRITLNDA